MYLERNIKLECRVEAFHTFDGEFSELGALHLENVELFNCGTHRHLHKACLTFDGGLKSDSSIMSNVTGSSIHHA